MDKETAKLLRHLPLGLTIDVLLAILIAVPVWVILHTPDNTYGPILSLHWWPWLAVVELGLLAYYAICEDSLALEAVAKAPKLIVYAVVLVIWWVFVGRQVLKEFEDKK